jgi:hypothetical protein
MKCIRVSTLGKAEKMALKMIKNRGRKRVESEFMEWK